MIVEPSPLLDLWQPPDGAGAPVAVLATTFVLEPDFFERDCLARFLGVDAVDEGSGSADDLVARLELEEALRVPTVTVLADRSARADRSSLRWTLLQCHVATGLFHPKAAMLLWENATRVVIGSANLTSAGYRRQIEIGMAADIGTDCLFDRGSLLRIADEFESYLDLVPGLNSEIPTRRRVHDVINEFRRRCKVAPLPRQRTRVVVAPTKPRVQPLEAVREVWSGPLPTTSLQLSPFWDADDPTVLDAVRALCSRRPVSDRWHSVAVVPGQASVPPGHVEDGLLDDVLALDVSDGQERALHAKCLILEGADWVAAMVGSSNHTRSGLGLGGSRRHRELNVWFGAARGTPEAQMLQALVPTGDRVSPAALVDNDLDEDEVDDDAAVLPAFFGLCRLSRVDSDWTLRLTFVDAPAPASWCVSLPSSRVIVDHVSLADHVDVELALDSDALPSFLDVTWDDCAALWPVVVDDRHDLPLGAGVEDLSSAQLLRALATGRSISEAVRDALMKAEFRSGTTGVVTDPLLRFDSHSRLLRHGRALASALDALERRLSQPVATMDALYARLRGPLGPVFIAHKTAADIDARVIDRASGLFTVAEIALTVSRVPWREVLRTVEFDAGIRAVLDSLNVIDDLRSRLGSTDDLSSYALDAVREARRCVAN